MGNQTVPTDLIVPEIFNGYLIQRTTELCALIKSGIATPDPSITLGKGGKTINLPFFVDPDAMPEAIQSDGNLTINKMTGSKDVAAILARGIDFQSSDLAELFSGADPQAAAASKLGSIWAKDMEKMALSALKGIFGVSGMEDSVLDNSASTLSANVMTDGAFLLGDHYNELTAIAVHSKVLAKMKKLDLVDDKMPSELMLDYDTYMGKRIIVDDAIAPSVTQATYTVTITGTATVGDEITVAGVKYTAAATDSASTIASALETALKADTTVAGKYNISSSSGVVTMQQKVGGVGLKPVVVNKDGNTATGAAATTVESTYIYDIYFFGKGAFAYNENPDLIEFETDRDIRASISEFVSRRVYTMHPRGVKWIGTPSGDTPSPAEFADSSNWKLVENRKNVRIAKIRTQV